MLYDDEPFNIEAFQGVWHEVASVGAIFEALCSDVRAEYTVLEPGVLGVKNTCKLPWGDYEITGIAKPTPDPAVFDVFLNGTQPGQLRCFGGIQPIRWRS